MACACFASGLTAVLEENHFGEVLPIIEAHRAIASDVVGPHTATRAPAVDLMNSWFAPQVKCAPSLDEICATRLRGEDTIRLAIGNERTTEDDVRRTWEVLQRCAG